MNVKTALAVAVTAVTAAASAYEGPAYALACWRGEETVVRMPDNLAGELGALATGDQVRVEAYVLDTVGYSGPGSTRLAMRYDRLVRADDSDAGVPGPAMLRVSVSEDAKPGVHDLGPVRVKVVDRVLPPPSEWRYLLDLWQHPWAVARYAGVEPFSQEHYAAMEPVWRTLAWCGVKPITTTLVELPWNHQCYDAYRSMIGRVRRKDGTWRFDYARFDEYVGFCRRCGLGPRIDCYTMCPWGYVVRWLDENGAVQRAKALPGTPEFADFWGDFLVDFSKHLKEKGWFDDVYIAMDERSPEDVRIIADFIREKAPGLKVQLAGNRNPSEFAGIRLDSYCQVLGCVTPEFLAEAGRRRERGERTTFYVCCGPERPNTFMTSGDFEPYWLGAYPAIAGLDGFLRWAANSWPRDPCDDAAFGNWAAGDTFLVYPDGRPSGRLLTLRAGVVAAEKLRILAAAGAFGEAERGAFAAKGFDCRKAMRGEVDFARLARELEEFVNR